MTARALTSWRRWLTWGVLCLACSAGGCGHPGEKTNPAATPETPRPQPTVAFTHPLLRNLQTYCYACHHGETGQTFDPFSRQPAFLAATSEPEVLHDVREVAGRAMRYLRSAQMPKATDPPLSKDKRRDIMRALKLLSQSPPSRPVATPDPAQLVQLRLDYDQQLRASLTYKCGACHGQEANVFQTLLFGAGIRLARQAWDSADGFPFGSDYAQDPLLQVNRLEVAVVTQSMPPLYYTASFPSRQLSADDIARVQAWVTQARQVYSQAAAPRGATPTP